MSNIYTASGKYVNPLCLQSSEVNIDDIAHALSMKCRFSGHCKQFYSVAEHSVYVSTLVDDELKKFALLHDAAEAYLMDVPRPYKDDVVIRHRDFTEIEDDLLSIICGALNVSIPANLTTVKLADTMMLKRESQVLMPETFSLDVPILSIEIKGLCPWDAKTKFLQTWASLNL